MRPLISCQIDRFHIVYDVYTRLYESSGNILGGLFLSTLPEWSNKMWLIHTRMNSTNYLLEMKPLRLKLWGRTYLYIYIYIFELRPSSSTNGIFCLSVRLSVRPSVTPFWLCSHHRIIMKFSGVITSDRSDDHAKGQGQRSKVKVTEVTTQTLPFPDCNSSLNSRMMMKWCI